MEWMFGKKKTPDQMLRENKRMLNRAMREMDREKRTMEAQEKKLIVEIKKTAKAGQMDAVRIMAKDLVRTRGYIKKFLIMKTNIQAVSLKISALKSQNAMANAMKGVTKAMGRMNKQMNMASITKIMQEFEKQNEMMEMKSEMMDDAIDDAMEGSDEEEESDQVVQQVLDELGLQLTDELTGLPAERTPLSGPQVTAKNSPAPQAVGADSGIDANLEERLKNLKRD